MHKWIMLTLSLVLLQISRHGAKAAHATEVPMQKELIVAVVLDESGSMGEGNKKEATISGYNEYLDSLKRQKEISKVTLTRFNGAGIKLNQEQVRLTAENYKPDSNTPLYDAIHDTVKQIDKMVCDHRAVLFVIMTDGFENASTHATRDQVRELLAAREKEGWTFVYMGSDKSTYLNALDIGITQGNTMQFDDKNWKGGIRALATETAVHMNTGAQNFGASVSAAGGFFTSTETKKVKEETPK